MGKDFWTGKQDLFTEIIEGVQSTELTIKEQSTNFDRTEWRVWALDSKKGLHCFGPFNGRLGGVSGKLIGFQYRYLGKRTDKTGAIEKVLVVDFSKGDTVAEVIKQNLEK